MQHDENRGGLTQRPIGEWRTRASNLFATGVWDRADATMTEAQALTWLGSVLGLSGDADFDTMTRDHCLKTIDLSIDYTPGDES